MKPLAPCIILGLTLVLRSAGEEAAPAPASPAQGTPAGAAAPQPGNEGTVPPPVGDSPQGSSATPVDPAANPSSAGFLQRSNLILAKLIKSERSVDPFGMPMDPGNAQAAPVIPENYKEVEEETPQLNSLSLKSALETLPITGIYPNREILVLGARTFKVGGQFGMKLDDLVIRLRFDGIRNGELFFTDMETREVTSIPFNPRPEGFEPISKGKKRPPGEGISSKGELFIVN